jgi:succinate dehydrogenase / fumarate reductase flavoprotein subunit
MELEKHEYDVVVVGAGGAGLRAAIEAHENGARTAVVSSASPCSARRTQ